MAKEKAKHDGLLCFLLALIVVLILVIGGGAYYFLVVDNGEKIAEKPEQSIENEKGIEGSVKLSEQEIEFFNEYFFVSANYRTPAINGILSSDFTDARDIGLTDLLYTFAQSKPNRENFDYKEYTGGEEVEEKGTIYKVTRKEFDDFLVNNTGYSLNEFSEYKAIEEGFYISKYIKEYDAFYVNPQGAWSFGGRCVSGEKIGNKYILNFKSMNYGNTVEEYSTMVLEKLGENFKIVSNNVIKRPNTENNLFSYFLLYNGFEMLNKTGVQWVSDMEKTNENTTKYHTTYYNYENGKYLGQTIGTFGEETFHNHSMVSNVSRIAMSKKYNAIPRKYTEITELPKQLENNNYTSAKIHSIDLDNDGKNENILCWKIDYKKGNAENKEIQASSGIILMDSNYNKINDLVTLENGFWANIKEEERKQFLTLEKVEYIDIDEDGIMEIIIEVPAYEGTQLSVVKYNKGKIDGHVNYKASLQP